jgi:diguanylate cyclase (GGDEF)-like protein
VPTLDVLLGAFGAGIYLIVALTHLDLWIRRRERTGHLWLAATSASALVVDHTGIAAAFAPPAPLPALLMLNLLGVSAATAALVEMVSSLNQETTSRLVRRLQFVVLAGALAIVGLPQLAAPVLIICGILLIASMTRAVRAARSARGPQVVARAFLVLAVCLLADLIKEVTPLPIPSNLPLAGFTVLFLAAARSLNQQFEHEHEASHHDSLTGLHNRRGFMEAWEDALHRSRRSGRPVSIVLADLDHFKQVNDTRGHAAGDLALRAVARTLRASLRAQDVVARWGGEEFMLLLPDTDAEGARRVAESARTAVEELRLENGDAAFGLTLSLGVSEHDAGRRVDETIAAADDALYRAKQEGRNRVVMAPGC